MKKAIFAALLASATFFGSEAMESPALGFDETKVLIGFICDAQPPVSIYRMNDGSLSFISPDSEANLPKTASVLFIGGATFNGIFVAGDTLEINPDMTDEEIIDAFKLHEITVRRE